MDSNRHPSPAERLTLRPAVEADASAVFAWRNLPTIVEAAARKETVAWEDHRRWFAESLRRTQRVIFIVECNGEPAGQVRFDRVGNGSAQISLYLLPPFTGRGLGVEAIRQGCRRLAQMDGPVRIEAWVRTDNAPSLSAFRKAGFAPAADAAERPGLRCWELRQSPPVPHNRLTHGPEEEEAVVRVVRSGKWAGGEAVASLEDRMARMAGGGFGIGVGSGLGALRLALLGLGIGRGDAVAVPAYSCVALANAVLACGAEPVAVEVDPGTWNISVEAVRELRARRRNLRAAVAVHTFGCAAPVRELEALGLPVVEDCSHAFGVAPLGGMGRIAVLSLYATKLIGAGEGGMILTKDATLARRLREARDYTDQSPAASRLNDKLTELAAALALCQMDRLPRTLVSRATLARRYAELLDPAVRDGLLALPVDCPGRVWYRYAALVDDAAEVASLLAERGVDAVRPVEKWCAEVTGPVAEAAFRRVISLPLYPTLTNDEQDRVVAALLETLLARVPA